MEKETTMVLQFMTKRNINGGCKFVAIDTEKKEFALRSSGFSSEGTPQIAVRDWRMIVAKLRNSSEFKEVDYVDRCW